MIKKSIYMFLGLGVLVFQLQAETIYNLDALPAKYKVFLGPQKIGTHQIELKKISIDKTSNKSEYTYKVTSGSKPAISHWVIEFAAGCGAASAYASSSDSLGVWTESDPTTKIRGVKFDTGYKDKESREVKLVLNGIFYPHILKGAIKAGRINSIGNILTPSCLPDPMIQQETPSSSGSVLDFNTLPVKYKVFLGPQMIGTHKIELTKITIDKASNKSEYTYKVTSGSKPAISHWVIEFAAGCGAASAYASSSDSLGVWTESDPTTKIRGVKFDTGYKDKESREVKLVLNGIFYPHIFKGAIKAGRINSIGNILTPSCSSLIKD
jgi:streptomycin 6-kinase